jgi:MarR family transcriptional regulator, organic hydroperoxide resistance regulator
VSKVTATSGEQPGDLPALGDVLEFMRLLWAVDHGLQKKSKLMAGSIGLTGPQRLVIRIAGRFPGISAGQLAAILHVDPSTLTGVLRRLQQRGLLSRRPDPKDARRAALGLTRRGRKMDVEATGTIESVVCELLATQPQQRIRATREVLRVLAASLGVHDQRESAERRTRS